MQTQQAISQLSRGIYTGNNTVDLAEAISQRLFNLWQNEQIATWLEDNVVLDYDTIETLAADFVESQQSGEMPGKEMRE